MSCPRIISIITLICMLAPQVALAQNVPSPDREPLPTPSLMPGEKDPGLVISPMKKGQRAPFTGILLAPTSAANIIVEMEMLNERIRIDVDRAIKQEQADCERKVLDLNASSIANKKILQANIDEKGRTIDSLLIEVKSLKDEKTTMLSPVTWVGIGTAGGILLTILTAFAISNSTK